MNKLIAEFIGTLWLVLGGYSVLIIGARLVYKAIMPVTKKTEP